jgi:hypothetical protein
MEFTQYTKTLSEKEVAYYKKAGVKAVDTVQLLLPNLIEDWKSGVLNADDLNDVLSHLSFHTKKTAYNKILDSIDLLNPDEDILNLADLIDLNLILSC